MLDIFKLIYEYSKNGKLVDKEFIEKLVQLEIGMKNLGSYYIQNINILSKYAWDEEAIAGYCNGNLNVYMKKMYEKLEIMDKSLDLFSNIEKIFFKNVSVTQVILHEIEHANQVKKRGISQTIESDILRLCYGFNSDLSYAPEFLQKKLKNPNWLATYIKDNYFCVPYERLAEMHSCNEMLSILDYMPEYFPNLLEFFEIRKMSRLIMGYLDQNGNLISPTLKYLQGMDIDKYLLECPWYNEKDFASLNDAYMSQFDLSERLKYGFPITEEEFSTTSVKLIHSKFYNVGF